MRFIVALVALVACQPDPTVVPTTAEDIWTQSPTNKVDILWVVDNSNSMATEQALLAQHFGDFAAQLEWSGVEFQLGVITTEFDYADPMRGALLGEPAVLGPHDDYDTLFRERVQVGTDGSGREKGLEAATHALSAAMLAGPNQGFGRPDADTLVVVVSDEDDCSDEGALNSVADNLACYSQSADLVPVETWVARLQASKSPPYSARLAAIVGPDDASDACEGNTVPGLRYMEVARQTGGTIRDICEGSATSLSELGLIATGIHTTFFLAHGAQPGSLEVFVNDVLVPADPFDGYTYDAQREAITFHGSEIPPRYATVRATYAIEPGT